MIRIYTTPACPFCKMAKQFLKQNDIKFEEIDVSRNKKAAEEMIKKSGQASVPVIEIDDKIIVGFDIERLKKVLRL